MALSCHSQANHQGRGSDATLHTWFLDLLPSDPQRWGALSVACHPGGGWCLSLCLTLDMHCCWCDSWWQCIISLHFFFFTLCHPTRRLRQHSPSFLLAILRSFLMVMYQRCSTFYRCVVCLMFVRTKPNTNPTQTDIKLVYEPHLYYSTLNVYYLLFLNLKSFQLHGTVPFSLQNYRAGWPPLYAQGFYYPSENFYCTLHRHVPLTFYDRAGWTSISNPNMLTGSITWSSNIITRACPLYSAPACAVLLTWMLHIWPSYLKVGWGHYRGLALPSVAIHTYIHT